MSKYIFQDDLWWHRGWGTTANESSPNLLDLSWVVKGCSRFGACTVSLAKERSRPARFAPVAPYLWWDLWPWSNHHCFQHLPLLLFRLAFLTLLTYNVYTILLNATLPLILVPLHMRSHVHALYTDRYDLQISTPKNILVAVRFLPQHVGKEPIFTQMSSFLAFSYRNWRPRTWKPFIVRTSKAV